MAKHAAWLALVYAVAFSLVPTVEPVWLAVILSVLSSAVIGVIAAVVDP